jgi:hypothetical protein
MWWTAPPRYDTPVEVYKEQIRSRLVTIKNTLDTPIILEYGNELWNSDFPVHHTLTPKWYVKAAKEISILKDVADSVFGKTPVFGKKPYYLFAGSHFQQIDTTALIITELDTLGITPDIVGPAFYVGPKREDVLFWQERGTVPTQADLQHSCYARLTEMKTKLFEHVQIVRSFGVEYAGLYECGQSFIAKGHPWREAAITAQPTTWLGNLMQATREVIHQQGVDVACWYSAASSQTPDNKQLDVFGFLEGVGKPVMPKAYAIMDKI